MKTALITGASGGIGLELAKIHASKGGNLVIVARSEEKLLKLKSELESTYKVSVFVIVKDLSDYSSIEQVYKEVKAQNIKIDYLINNAGFGAHGFFSEIPWEKEYEMIQLNITCLTYLTKLFLNDLISQKSGRIMNLASTAAFQPGPTMAVYFASKAFVLSFSEALHNELEGTGITVTALCPGPTQSDFFSTANMNNSKLVKGKNLPTAHEVALYGYTSMLKGKPVAIHGIKNKLLAFSVRFSPRNLVTKVTRKMQESALK